MYEPGDGGGVVGGRDGQRFWEAPRPFMLLVALTELRLLAGHPRVESIIKQTPDVVLKLPGCGSAGAGAAFRGSGVVADC